MSDNAPPFDPSEHLIKLQGNKDYLTVAWRLVWFRHAYPHGTIGTDLVHMDDRVAVFKATVSDGEGGSATGFGSETPGDFRDYIEKAETKAIGRALGALGYGTQFTPDFDEGAERDGTRNVVDSPVMSTREPRAAPQRTTVRQFQRPAAGPGGAPGSAEGITEPQRKKMWAVGMTIWGDPNECGSQIKAKIARMFGKQSSQDLTKAEATQLIDDLLLHQVTANDEDYSDVPALAAGTPGRR